MLEVKGDFCHDVRRMLEAHGRAADYVEVSLDGPWRYNPLHNDLDAYALAYGIASLLNSVFGKGKEPFWQQAYTNLIKFIILLHKVVDDYVTLFDVYECAIGLFGGPVGLAIGAATGAAAGATADMARARLDQDFVADISESLAPGKTALVAEINEDEPEAVDGRMHALGGRIFRRDLSDFVDADYELRANEVKRRVARVGRDIAHDYSTRKRNLTSRVKALFHTGDRDDEGSNNKR